jgi:hypothetical protein
VGSTLALAHPLYYNRLVQLASTIKFVHHLSLKTIGNLSRGIDNNDSLRRNMYTFLKGILYSLTRRGTFIYIYIYIYIYMNE